MEYKHEIIDNVTDERFYWTIKKFLSFLKQEIKIMFDKEDKESGITEKQLMAYQGITKLPDSFLKDSNKGIYENYIYVSDSVDPKPPKISGSDNVWEHIRVDSILIPRHKNSQHIFFFLEIECDWEEEHGLEILFKDYKPILFTQQEGLSSSEEWEDYIK